jgi:hypothetical protein
MAFLCTTSMASEVLFFKVSNLPAVITTSSMLSGDKESPGNTGLSWPKENVVVKQKTKEKRNIEVRLLENVTLWVFSN